MNLASKAVVIGCLALAPSALAQFAKCKFAIGEVVNYTVDGKTTAAKIDSRKSTTSACTYTIAGKSGIAETALSTYTAPPKTSADWLAPHNDARKAVGNDPLKWSDSLATSAAGYASKMAALGGECIINHNLAGDTWSGGENIGQAMTSDISAADVIKSFTDESQYFKKATMTCEKGKVCGHYTQVISQKSTEVGCAQAACTATDGKKHYMYVCRYTPSGNQMKPGSVFVGLFK